MGKSVTVTAPGKVNLVLDITGRQPDGYHILDSVMQSISLSDTITVSCMDGRGIYSSCDQPRIPCDENNLVYKATRAFLDYFFLDPGCAISIDLQKRLPIEAGLGGGSTDAAAVLIALNVLLNVYTGLDTLCKIGEKVGADVPFCILGGTRRITDSGSTMHQMPPMPYCYLLIAKPEAGISTPQAFARYDALTSPARADTTPLLHGLYAADLKQICSGMHNVLEPVADVEDVFALKKMILAGGALGAVMSGSGSAVVGVFENRDLAKRCMRRTFSLAKSAFLCTPVSHGAIITK